jgi:hypothetical protein
LATLLFESNIDATAEAVAPSCKRIVLSQPTPWEELERQEIAVLSHELIRQACDWLEPAS